MIRFFAWYIEGLDSFVFPNMFTRKIHLYCTIYYLSWFISFLWYFMWINSFYHIDIFGFQNSFLLHDIFRSEIHFMSVIYWSFWFIYFLWYIQQWDSFSYWDLSIFSVRFEIKTYRLLRLIFLTWYIYTKHNRVLRYIVW